VADNSHDTDPLADTQAPEAGTEASASSSSGATNTSKRRNVNAGDTLGRYELVDDIGEGGMATVYRARDKELRREVAVKVLFPHLARREEVVRRFHREARAAAGLEHANILRVYDVGGGETDDPPYIVMELIRGHSLLGEIERRGPMLAEVAACIGALLADALAVAHKAGIVHRDIKPANVMIATDGRVLLADFGVARLETEDSLVTKTGSVLGTPAYMAPEQASGDTATAKSDLYSLGATLYQLATGTLPYTGSPAKVLAQIAAGQFTPAVKKRTHVGPDLSRLIDRLMAVEPTARPAHAAEVAAELRKIASAGGFGEAKDELIAYFADPDGFVTQKTPTVVAALVKAGEHAIDEGKLPRAIAIADRASALAPDDPAVAQLVAHVTEGGRSSRRRRVVAIAGIAVVVAGGATAGAMQLLGDSSPGVTAARDATIVHTESPADAAVDDAPVIATSEVPDGAVAMITDAGIGGRARDAGVIVRTRDAAIAASVDAAPGDAVVEPAVTRPDAAVPAKGFIVVISDGWCDVTIDGVKKNVRAGGPPIEVDAGPHTVTCEQPGLGKSWSKQVTVGAGAKVEARGSILGRVAVTFAVDAKIGATSYTAGQTAQLPAARYQVEIGGKRTHLDITRTCQIRNSPEIGCY
jgi:eukaryotic-like serine/threonine-protein kinase